MPLRVFLTEVLAVVACHKHFDPVHELLAGLRIGAENFALLHQVDIEPRS